MGDILKLFFLLLIVLFIVTNSKADKTAIEDGIVVTNDFPHGSEYNVVLAEEKILFK